MIISRTIEFDYGHCLPLHYGFCNQLHGHRGKLVAFFEGDIQENATSSNGMVEDFSVCKDILEVAIKDKIDHAFAIWNNADDDKVVIKGKRYDGFDYEITVPLLEIVKVRNTRVLLLDKPPTAEVLATWAVKEIKEEIKNRNLKIKLVTLHWYETPNNVAILNVE